MFNFSFLKIMFNTTTNPFTTTSTTNTQQQITNFHTTFATINNENSDDFMSKFVSSLKIYNLSFRCINFKYDPTTSAFGPTTNGLYCYPPAVNGCSASWTDHLPLLGGILLFMNIFINKKKIFLYAD